LSAEPQGGGHAIFANSEPSSSLDFTGFRCAR
jgi:hypothetical protein